MPKFLIYGLLALVILAMIPPAVIARKRSVPTDKRRIHYVQDMDNQHKFRAQHTNPLFADGRSMRPPVVGTVARGDTGGDAHFDRGLVGDDWATDFPPSIVVDMDTMKRGQERFNIYCQPCHGLAGYGDGIVNKRANELMQTAARGTTWVAPKSIHERAIREQPVGQIFNTITNGVRNMSGYKSQVTTADRWAIVAYVRALQRSQHAEPSDVPAAERDELDVVRMIPVVEEGAEQ